jgi:hypothetical protein
MVPESPGDQIFGKEINRGYLIPWWGQWLINRFGLKPVLDQADLSGAIIREMCGARRSADFVIVDEDPSPWGIGPHRKPAFYTPGRRE